MRILFAVVAFMACTAHARDCSVSAGVIFSYDHESTTGTATIGCDVAGFDVRAHFVGPRERPFTGMHFGELVSTRYEADAYAALSVMRYWSFRRRFQFGLGLFLKEDDRFSSWEWCETSECIHGNPWVPSPVSVIASIGFRHNNWAARLGHISNAGTSERNWNWGQEYLRFERYF